MFACRDVGSLPLRKEAKAKAGWKKNELGSWKKAEWIVSSTHIVLLCFSPFFLYKECARVYFIIWNVNTS